MDRLVITGAKTGMASKVIIAFPEAINPPSTVKKICKKADFVKMEGDASLPSKSLVANTCLILAS